MDQGPDCRGRQPGCHTRNGISCTGGGGGGGWGGDWMAKSLCRVWWIPIPTLARWLGADRSAPIPGGCAGTGLHQQPPCRLYESQAGGITTVNVMPGSGHLLSGQTSYLKLRNASSIEQLAIRTESGGMAWGIKMANGTNPLRASPFPVPVAKRLH